MSEKHRADVRRALAPDKPHKDDFRKFPAHTSCVIDLRKTKTGRGR